MRSPVLQARSIALNRTQSFAGPLAPGAAWLAPPATGPARWSHHLKSRPQSAVRWRAIAKPDDAGWRAKPLRPGGRPLAPENPAPPLSVQPGLLSLHPPPAVRFFP